MTTTAPTLRDEAWRYADPAALKALSFPVDLQALHVEEDQVLVETVSCGSQGHTITVAPGKTLHHFRHFSADLSAPAYAKAEVELAEGARYVSHVLNTAGTYIRNEIDVTLAGKGSHADLLGLYMLQERGHSDTLTRIHHAVADTTSDEVYKGVVRDKSRGVFQAQIRVAPDAQRIVGNQMHRALMLSDDARIDTKPELEIFADDVQCSHGSTIADLDAQQLFYMAARGIPESKARALLIEAFAAEFLDDAPEAAQEPFRVALAEFLHGF